MTEWNSECFPFLTPSESPLEIKGRVYNSCIKSSTIYGSETRPLLADVGLKFERREMQMNKWMWGVSWKSDWEYILSRFHKAVCNWLLGYLFHWVPFLRGLRAWLVFRQSIVLFFTEWDVPIGRCRVKSTITMRTLNIVCSNNNDIKYCPEYYLAYEHH